MERLNRLKEELNQREKSVLSKGATASAEGIRQFPEASEHTEYRQTFAVDVDRILHSLAYTRYIDKTQVFYLIKNDHISHRVLHVQLVSKIARTIGRFLALNEDLIEAIALSHDIGHTPFGHDGERFLSELCRRHGIGHFRHNIQSIQFLDKVERKGKGWNLCLQTLDGILCHDGEIHDRRLQPQHEKTFEVLHGEIAAKKKDPDINLNPMTMEGCVVRMADTISYIGRDIEDALRLGLIKRSQLPKRCVATLGNTNGTIVFNLVTDVIENSYQKAYISFSEKVSEALEELKAFNMAHIYTNRKIKRYYRLIDSLFGQLFERYLEDIQTGNSDSVIFSSFLKDMSSDYVDDHCSEEIVRDFIAGMTDQYFLAQCPEKLKPQPMVF